MVIDVGPLLRGEVKKIDIDYMLTPETLWGIEFESDAHVTGSLTDSAGYMRLVLKAELNITVNAQDVLLPSMEFSLLTLSARSRLRALSVRKRLMRTLTSTWL